MGKQGYGIDPERLSDYAKQIKEISEMGVQIGIVIGGGNIFRGLSGSQKGFDRVKGDQMGMCATVINSLALSSALGAIGVKNKVLTAIRMEPIGEFYTWCEEQGADGHPYGADRRVLHEVEGHRGDGGRLCVHLLGWHRITLLHHGYGLESARHRDRGRRDAEGHACGWCLYR